MKIDINDIKHAFFIGIGGVSMSSLASILMYRGVTVSGYDMTRSDTTKKLAANGAVISYDINTIIPDSVDTVVYTAAVKVDHPLLLQAKRINSRILSRAELLSSITNCFNTSIGIAGTHGKSTTTGLISSICVANDKETAVLSGANLPFLGASFKPGTGKRIVYEACEYKNSYHSMIPSIKVILNCEHDHVDFFPTIEDVKESFSKFIQKERYPGSENISVVNYDCVNCVDLCKNIDCKIYYYSISSKKDFYAFDIDMCTGYGVFSIMMNDGKIIPDIHLRIPGIHNVSNSVAAAAAAYLSGVNESDIKKGLEEFSGVSRRFEYLGEYNGARIYDDYAHHPDEIEATLKTAKSICKGDVICVFQPHTFSRTYELQEEFSRTLSIADKIYVCAIYPAREINTTGVSSYDIVKRMKNAEYIESFDDIVDILKKQLKCDDFCLTMGAGEANKIAMKLLNI